MSIQGIKKNAELKLKLLDCQPVIGMMNLCLHLLNSEFKCLFQFTARLLVEKDEDFRSVIYLQH